MRHPMIKSLIVFACLVAFAAPAAAIGPGIGVRLGGSGGDLSVEPSDGITDGPSPRWGFAGGVYKGISLAPMTSIEVGAYYVQKGAKATFAIGGEQESKLDYIEIPALFKVKPVAFPIYVAAGGYLGFKLSAKAKGSGSDWVDMDDISSTDLGFAFAIGADFPLTAVALNFDLRYDLGMTDIDKTDETTMKTRTLIASVGVYF